MKRKLEKKKPKKEPLYKQRLKKTEPNKLEKSLINLIELHKLPFRFVGNGQLWISKKCPDFVSTSGERKLIEIFGSHWHPKEDEQKRKDHFTKYGFDTLVIWDYEMKQEKLVLTKLVRFLRGTLV